jgi:hypothetical protein
MVRGHGSMTIFRLILICFKNMLLVFYPVCCWLDNSYCNRFTWWVIFFMIFTKQVHLTVMLKPGIGKVLRLHLGWDANYPGRGFSWFSWVLSGGWWGSISVRLWLLSNSASICNHTIQWFIVLILKSFVK